MRRCCKLLQRLTADTILWRHILHSRNAARIQSLLFELPQRPTRMDLARANILRVLPGITRQLSDGAYIGEYTAVRSYEALRFIERRMAATRVERRLTLRPGIDEMRQRNLIPRYGQALPSGTILVMVQSLNRAMKLDTLRRHLRSRISADALKERGVAKIQTVTSYNRALLPQAVLLEKRLLQSRLSSKLERRPSASTLEGMKVLRSDSSSALLICPPIRDKVQFFEGVGRKRAMTCL
ncbi:hypothetical protein DFJ73DRAFT_204290 [Zopfochytrium polystomum]|nr:hypothetical protein DFJ73DRAFT_204290 [Zopfochytrium polystomum]